MDIAKPQSAQILTVPVLTGIILLVAAGVVGHFYAATEKDVTGFSWLGLLSVLQLTPFILGLFLRSQNYLNFILLSHFAGFSLSKWNEEQYLGTTKMLSASWIHATHELIICTILMGIGYYVSRIVLLPERLRRVPFSELTLTQSQIRMIAAYVWLIPILERNLPFGFLIIHFALANAQILLIICSHSLESPNFMRVAKWSISLVAMVNFLLSGFLTMFGQYATFLIVYGFTRGKRKFLLGVVLLVVFVSAIQSVKNSYRTFLNSRGGSLFENASVLSFLLAQKYFEAESTDYDYLEVDREDTDKALIRGFGRIGDDSLERVLAMTPSIVPFWDGETYNSIPFMFIPRVLWPDKPGRHFWNKFGRAYHVLSEDDVQTSVGVGFLAEAYMNFGYGWMYMLAVIMGVFFVLIERLSMTLLKGKFYFPYIAYLGPIIGLGADLGSIVNSTVILTCCMFLARPFLLRLAESDDYV